VNERAGGLGLGLGLYICRETVLRHGGQIEATCPEDGGTRVAVTLPLRAGIRESKPA
jgi:signal transduction histidine kinase